MIYTYLPYLIFIYARHKHYCCEKYKLAVVQHSWMFNKQIKCRTFCFVLETLRPDDKHVTFYFHQQSNHTAAT